MTDKTKTGAAVYTALFLIAFGVAFTSSFNPFAFTRMHVDSSVYITIARGITRGQLPYRDFVDNKGPLAYLLSVPGLLLGGFTGVWITELLLICVTVFFAYKTALFFGDKHTALLGTACVFIVYLVFFYTCAGTEEYSAPFLMISFYIFTRYWTCSETSVSEQLPLKQQNAERFAGLAGNEVAAATNRVAEQVYYLSGRQEASMPELVILGFCFACAVLIRLNMFPLWAGFCLIIFANETINRRFTLLGKYMLGFCAGVLVVVVPICFYLKANNILGDFLEQVIFAGAAKGFDGAGSLKQTAKNFFIILDRYYCILPLFIGVFWFAIQYKNINPLYIISYVLSYILMILFMSFSSGDSHYNLVLAPYFVPALVYVVEILKRALSGRKHQTLWLLFLLCVIFSESLIDYLNDLRGSFISESGKDLVAAGKTIDDNTVDGDTIISLGINGYIYPFTRRKAASKYLYQGSGIDHIAGAREGFLSDILTGKPAIIAVFGADDGRYDYLPGWYTPVYDMMEREYTLLSDANGYYLFKRNQ